MNRFDDADLGDALRQAFAAQAQAVPVTPGGLATIRARLARRTRLSRGFAMGFSALATATVATATIALAGLGSCVPQTPQPGQSATPSTPVTTPATTPAPTPTSPQPSTTSTVVPVYFVSDLDNHVVLFREFLATTAGGTITSQISAAVTLMLRGDPLDPDYSTGWPKGAAVRSVQLSGGIATVDISGAKTNSVGTEGAYAAVQQLVWTVTAVGADQGVPINAVRLRLDGAAAGELWGAIDVSGPLTRGNALDTLAPVWLISPQHGQTVGRTFQVHLSGSVYEASAILRVRDSTGKVVSTQPVQLDNGPPSRGQAFVSLNLAPGQYTLEAFYYSPEDGSIRGMDDHDIVVR